MHCQICNRYYDSDIASFHPVTEELQIICYECQSEIQEVLAEYPRVGQEDEEEDNFLLPLDILDTGII